MLETLHCKSARLWMFVSLQFFYIYFFYQNIQSSKILFKISCDIKKLSSVSTIAKSIPFHSKTVSPVP